MPSRSAKSAKSMSANSLSRSMMSARNAVVDLARLDLAGEAVEALDVLGEAQLGVLRAPGRS